MDFNYWMKVYNRASPGSEQAIEALDKMIGLAVTFDQWRNVFFRAFSRTQKIKALDKMTELAHIFGQWLQVYYESEDGSELERSCLYKLIELADNPEKEAYRLPRWLKIFAIVPCESDIEKLTVKRIIYELKKTKEKKPKYLDLADRI